MHGGTMRPVTDRFPEPLDYLGQIWIREHAQAPGLVDGLITPEVVLLFKASGDRRRDRWDLEVCWPLLDDARRSWLRESMRRLYPEHPWNDLLDLARDRIQSPPS